MQTRFFFDLDGTITRRELLPLIGRELNLEHELNLLTNATITGALPFDSSFKLRVQLLKSVPIAHIHQILESVELNQEIVEFIQNNRERCVIVTNNLDVWIAPLCEKLGCSYSTSIANVIDGNIEGIEHILRKVNCLKEYPDSFNVCIGDGVNDAEMIRMANLGIAFGGVHDISPMLLEVCDVASYSERSLCNLLKQL